MADRMARTGLGWHQQTVAKIERGTRPLRLEEAVALATALGVAVNELYEEGPGGEARRAYRELRNRVLLAQRHLDHLRRQLALARAEVETTPVVLSMAESDYRAMKEELRQARAALKEEGDDGELGEEA